MSILSTGVGLLFLRLVVIGVGGGSTTCSRISLGVGGGGGAALGLGSTNFLSFFSTSPNLLLEGETSKLKGAFIK